MTEIPQPTTIKSLYANLTSGKKNTIRRQYMYWFDKKQAAFYQKLDGRKRMSPAEQAFLLEKIA